MDSVFKLSPVRQAALHSLFPFTNFVKIGPFWGGINVKRSTAEALHSKGYVEVVLMAAESENGGLRVNYPHARLTPEGRKAALITKLSGIMMSANALLRTEAANDIREMPASRKPSLKLVEDGSAAELNAVERQFLDAFRVMPKAEQEALAKILHLRYGFGPEALTAQRLETFVKMSRRLQ
jgi:hypothetical protein